MPQILQKSLHNLLETLCAKQLCRPPPNVKHIDEYLKTNTIGENKLRKMHCKLAVGVKKLSQEVPTGWNSTLKMAKFVEIEDAIIMVITVLNADVPLLSAEE